MKSRLPPFEIRAVHSLHTASILRDLANRAEAGEVIGLAVALVDSGHNPEFHRAGTLSKNVGSAHWVVSLMQDMLLDKGRRS